MPVTPNVVSKLREIVGEANVITYGDQLKTYAVDGKVPAIAVSPGTIEEVSKIVACANQECIGVIPRGNGTKMGIGGVPERADLILLTGRLNRIKDCDCENLTLSVESGITLNEVQQRLAKEGKGYFLPLDPSYTEKATLGGIIATNSSGPKRFGYGTGRDMITGMKAVLPNGEVVTSGGKTVKNVSGYDMCKLLIGSMGTLGIISEITFNLRPLPEKEATVLLSFKTLEDAGNFIHEVLHSHLLPVAIETLNATAAKRMTSSGSIPPGGNYLVAIGLEGVSESIDRQVAEMGSIGKKHGALEALNLNSGKNHSFWVQLRDFDLGMKKEVPSSISLKANFLISKWTEVLKGFEGIAKGAGLDCSFICHAGNGLLYSYLRADKGNPASLARLVEAFASEAVKNEGNLVVESSPLDVKEKIDVWGAGRADRQIMRRIKEEIDSARILNPGRFVGGI
jgi:glycolate oxidase FAD binding subunit